MKDRYTGLQDILTLCGESGCHFLTLLTIIEEENKAPVDLIKAIRICQSKGFIRSDFFVTSDGTPILRHFTHKEWTREVVKELPKTILENQYTEAVHFNKRTSYEHFHRRYIDTKENSVTVKEGKIDRYYIYTCKR